MQKVILKTGVHSKIIPHYLVLNDMKPCLSHKINTTTQKPNSELNDNIICDIIIITYNGLEYTKKCIESVERNTSNIEYRYIFVDNDSTDGTLEYLHSVKHSIIISNSENLGFAKAMNQGLERVSAKYTVWLNNDTIVTPNWLKYLIEHLENSSNVAAIGPVSNATGVIQKVSEFDEQETIESINEFGKKIHSENNNKVIDYHRIAGFCIVMRSELIQKIGMLDETFNFGGYDDDDYCKRIINAGYRILIAQDVFIYHKSGATFSRTKDPDLDLSYLMQIGRRKFLTKWVSSRKEECDPNKTIESLISIIMTTMNRKKIIPRAITSIINQTYKKWELIIINDGGENISDVINEYSDSRIKYINLDENHGKSYANNFAIERSNGEIIAYLDDDDYWYPNHLEAAIKELTKYESRMFVYTDYVQVDCIVDRTGNQIPLRKEIMSLKEARARPVEELNFIPNFCMVHRRSLFDKSGYFDEILDYYEDWDILRRFSRHTHFVHIPEVTGEYWINQLGTSRNALALNDRKLESVLNYIKSKKIPVSNKIVNDLDSADSMVSTDLLAKAYKLYKKILEKDPEFYPAIEGCADRLFTMKRYREAKEYWLKLLEINPYNFHAYIRATQNSIYLNEYKEAKKLLEFSLIISDDRHSYYLLQDCYRNLKNTLTAEFIKKKASIVASNISLKEIEEFLLALYNKSPFYRKLLIFSYKILKRISA